MTNQTESAPKAEVTTIAEYSKTEAALAEMREKYAKPYDVKTREGMTEAREARRVVKKVRTDLEAMREFLKAPVIARGKAIDAEAKRISAELSAIEDPIDKQITDEEARREEEKAKEARAAKALEDAANTLRSQLRALVTEAVGGSSETIAEMITTVREHKVPDDQYALDTIQLRQGIIDQLSKLHVATLAQEEVTRQQQAERAKLDADRAAADAKAKADAAKAEADAKAARETIEAEQRASRERIAADNRKADEARAAADAKAKAERDAADAKLRAERAKLDAERDVADAKAKAEKEKAEADAEAKAKAEREVKEAKERAAEKERVRKLDAHAMLETFVKLYGGLPEYAGVVDAIKATWLAAGATIGKKKSA